MANNLHTNNNYEIVVNTTADGYNVVNRITSVVEVQSTSLPECIFAAENLNVILVHRTYEWVAKQAAERMAAEESPVTTQEDSGPALN